MQEEQSTSAARNNQNTSTTVITSVCGFRRAREHPNTNKKGENGTGHKRSAFEYCYQACNNHAREHNELGCRLNTSKTPEGRSATFRVQGSGFFFVFFFSSLGCSESDFVGLNLCTISCNIFLKKINLLSRLG